MAAYWMPSPSAFLFEPTPHAEAADFLTGKPLVSKSTFAGLLPELRARAFTVAGIESAAILQRLRDTLAELPRGGDWDTLKKQLSAELHPFLADDENPTNRNAANQRAELLLRTHGFQAYTVAQEAALADQLDIFPFKQYLSMGDARVRPAHAALDGLVLPVESPFWRLHTPPWDFGCRCRTAPLLEDEAAEIRQADATRPPEDRRTLDGPALARLENEGRLNRTVRDESGKVIRDGVQAVDVRAPSEKGGTATAYHFEPSTLRLTPDQLRARMEPEEWQVFADWSRKQTLSSSAPTTVWAWLNGEPAPPFIESVLDTIPPPIPPRATAVLPRKQKQSPKKPADRVRAHMTQNEIFDLAAVQVESMPPNEVKSLAAKFAEQEKEPKSVLEDIRRSRGRGVARSYAIRAKMREIRQKGEAIVRKRNLANPGLEVLPPQNPDDDIVTIPFK